ADDPEDRGRLEGGGQAVARLAAEHRDADLSLLAVDAAEVHRDPEGTGLVVDDDGAAARHGGVADVRSGGRQIARRGPEEGVSAERQWRIRVTIEAAFDFELDVAEPDCVHRLTQGPLADGSGHTRST